MSSLSEHIASLESENYAMTHDGHCKDDRIREAMQKLDTVVFILRQRQRELKTLGIEE
jgi:hypothetical protein